MTPATKVVLYTLRGCGFCVRARRLLESKNAAFEEVDVTFDDEARAEVRRRTGHPTFPQIFVGDDFVGGCDELYALDRAGRLDAMLA